MNAIELHHKDGRTAGVYYCSECKCVARTIEQAESCCADYKCTYCGVDVPRKNYRTACSSCIAEKEREKEAARFAAAEKVTEWDGWLYSDEIQGYNDGYYADVDELIDYIGDNTPDAEEMAELEEDELSEIPKLPEYLWTCDEERFATASLDSIMENISDRGYEDFDTADLKGTEELGAAIDAFNAANAHIVSYSPNYKKALILGMNRFYSYATGVVYPAGVGSGSDREILYLKRIYSPNVCISGSFCSALVVAFGFLIYIRFRTFDPWISGGGLNYFA